jgi:hypothetical protein
LEPAETILLAGAGGGFDIFCGLPLYFGLQAAGKKVYLANLSFSQLPKPNESLSPSLVRVKADTLRPQAISPNSTWHNGFEPRAKRSQSSVSCEPVSNR